MVNMRVVRLTSLVMPHFIISGTVDKKKWIHLIWMWKSAAIGIKKKNNKHSNKQTMLIRFFRTWINWLHWTKYIVMLYLHGFCYFAVSFQFTKRSWCLSNIYIEALYSWSTRGFLINPKFGINSSRKHVKNFCVTEIRYVYQRKYSKSESFFIRTPKTWI